MRPERRWWDPDLLRCSPATDLNGKYTINNTNQHIDWSKRKISKPRLTPCEEAKRDYGRPFMVSESGLYEDRLLFRIAKRMFDIVCSVIALILLSPLMAVALLAIVIEDPNGSPIFVQERIGRGGKTFRFYKMRSMCVDAEEKLKDLMDRNEAYGGKAFKMKDDPRVTKVGHFIRRTSIDELPQLINIIRGDMSIVGPRPALPNEYALYDEYEKQRFIVTPGLTCFWQITPGRHDISFDEWVAMDIKYAIERSWLLDLKLIAKTALKCVTSS